MESGDRYDAVPGTANAVDPQHKHRAQLEAPYGRSPQGRDGRRDGRGDRGGDQEVGATLGPAEGQGQDPKRKVKFIDFAKHDQRRGCCGDADVFEDFIVAGDLAKALEEKHRVFAAVRVKGDDCGDLPPGERLAKQAYARADFDFATLHKILEESDLKPRKNDRGEAFDSGAGDHKMHSYFTFGLFTHGGVQGITKLTVEYPHLSRYLNHFASLRLGANATWTSVSIGKNVNAKVHRDYNHLRGSSNYACSFGQSQGGGLWLEDRNINEQDTEKTGLVWKRGAGGAWLLPGRTHSTDEVFFSFDPHLNRATCPWSGDRWSMTFHTTRGITKVGKECCAALKRAGFLLPNLRGVRAAPVTRRPKKSVRSALANTAGRLSIMLTTFLCAAGSFMCEQPSDVHYDPIIMFEIGGLDATYEAAQLGKAVVEPMTWEDYDDQRRREDAVHFVRAASPKELRVNLDGMREDYEGEIVNLAKEQIEGGGSVVFKGGDPSLF